MIRGQCSGRDCTGSHLPLYMKSSPYVTTFGPIHSYPAIHPSWVKWISAVAQQEPHADEESRTIKTFDCAPTQNFPLTYTEHPSCACGPYIHTTSKEKQSRPVDRLRHEGGKCVGSEKGRNTMKNADSGRTDTGPLATAMPEGILLPERRPPARRHR